MLVAGTPHHILTPNMKPLDCKILQNSALICNQCKKYCGSLPVCHGEKVPYSSTAYFQVGSEGTRTSRNESVFIPTNIS